MKSSKSNTIYYTLLNYLKLWIGISGIIPENSTVKNIESHKDSLIVIKITVNTEKRMAENMLYTDIECNVRFIKNFDMFSNIIKQMKEYFNGERREFDIPYKLKVDGFRKKVLLATAQIPYGSVKTYREIAEKAGSPRAFRACGSALANNPLPLLIPCHRVIRSDGNIGNFGAGAHIKEMLLKLEGVQLHEGRLLKA